MQHENALKVAQVIPGASLLTYQHLGTAAPTNVLKWPPDCDRFFGIQKSFALMALSVERG
ncbi:MAG: hypothetical protein ACLSBB_11090 [Ruthenibacterium lactatiformans]